MGDKYLHCFGLPVPMFCPPTNTVGADKKVVTPSPAQLAAEVAEDQCSEESRNAAKEAVDTANGKFLGAKDSLERMRMLVEIDNAQKAYQDLLAICEGKNHQTVAKKVEPAVQEPVTKCYTTPEHWEIEDRPLYVMYAKKIPEKTTCVEVRPPETAKSQPTPAINIIEPREERFQHGWHSVY